MPTLTKQEQVAEAEARAAAGVDPQLNAGATDVIDDGAPADPGAQPRPAAPAADGTQRPAPPVRSAYDDKRAEIVSRFRSTRTEDADAARDDISDFARSGMPPEFEPPAPALEAAEAEPEAPGEEPAPAAKPTVRVKVRGQDMELSQEDLIAHAQKSLAAENYLDEAKGKLKEVDTLLRETRDRGPRAAQPDQHQVRPNGAQPAEDQPATDPAAGDPNTTDDPVTKLIETLQFGDPAEARSLLQNTIAAEVSRAVKTSLQSDRLRDEGARSQKVLADFLGQHAEIAADPKARAVIEYNIYEQQLEDLKALGVDPNQMQTPHGGPPTPAEIAMAHRWYRAEGMRVKSPKEMLEKATEDFLAWKGIAKPPEPTADPAARAAPRVDLSIDRSTRRQAIPQQPSRTAAPKPGGDQPAAPQARDRSSIVADMAQRRGLPRGKVIGA